MTARSSNQSKAQQLRTLYAEIPHLTCRRLCQESCGPIGCTRLERSLIVRRIGVGPKIDATFTCTLLSDGACRVYDLRPLICRLWGVVERMRCPHGCVPDRWLTDTEAYDLLRRANAIGGFDEKRFAREFESALTAALEAERYHNTD